MNPLCTVPVVCEVKLKNSGLLFHTEIIKLPFILLLSFCLTTIFQHYHHVVSIRICCARKGTLIGVYLALF